jgi:AcrR family transcriptional regulator
MARPRSFDEDKVLRIARDQFWVKGYTATSVDDIAGATGLGKGSFYGAFGDKRKIFVRVFDQHGSALVESVRQSLEGPDEGALDRLRSLVLGVADATAENSLRGCLIAKGTAELSEHDLQVRATAHRTFQALGELLTSSIAAAQRAGDLRQDADPARLAGLLLAVLRGIEALGKADGSAQSLRMIAETAISLLPRP